MGVVTSNGDNTSIRSAHIKWWEMHVMSFVTEYQRNFTSMGGIRFERKVLNCLQRIIPKNQCHCVLKLYDQTSFKKSFKLYISVFYLLPACVCICSYLHRTYTCVSVFTCMYSLYLHMYHLSSVTFLCVLW